MSVRTIGILGGGQLGRLIAQAARRLGFGTISWDPTPGGPAAQVCDENIVAKFDDPAAEDRFRSVCDIVTFEWENVHADLAQRMLTQPAASVLCIIQDRLVQRQWLAAHGFPQTRFGEAVSAADLPFGPTVVKCRKGGYDGKGQARFSSRREAQGAAIFNVPCVWEKFVEFEREISVILARGQDGQIAVFPIAENVHRNGILFKTRAITLLQDIGQDVGAKAVMLATRIAKALKYVGVLAVEMFLLPDGELLVNEIAPRVHNSGHYTLGGCITSQFEQHVRAVAGLPLGPTSLVGPSTMVNLLGDLWEHGEPDWRLIDQIPGLTRYLYGKAEARPGRKMGHYVVVGEKAPIEWFRANERLALLRR